MMMSSYSKCYQINSKYQLTNLLEMKKKAGNFFNVLFNSLLFAVIILSSCHKDDLKKENIASGTRILRFNVGQGFDEDTREQNRSFSGKSDIIYQKFSDGMEIEAIIEQDKEINSRINTIETVAIGTKVLAIIIDAYTNDIYGIHQLKVESDGKLSCEVPNSTVRIIFYSYNSSEMPTTNLEIGDHIDTTKENIEEYTKDVMRFETQNIEPEDTNLGKVIFKHLFSRVRVCMHYDEGVSSFKTTLENCPCATARVNIIKGNIYPNHTNVTIPIDSDEGIAQEVAYSSYKIIIPVEDTMPIQLNITDINGTSLTNKHIIFHGILLPGHSYTIHIYVKKDTGIIEGWGPGFYQWDAKALYEPGNIPSAGDNAFYNTGSNLASNSCINCPSSQDGCRMIASGVYWDDNGPTWKGDDGNTYTSGLWVKKKSQWGNLELELSEPKVATDEQRNSGDYVFLPASGYIADGEYEGFGEVGLYWTNTPNVDRYGALCFMFNSYSVSIRVAHRKGGYKLWHFPND
jgi:hypothetical protein